jgi:hypothetical protein
MVVGLHVWWWRRWALPCTFLTLVGCTPLPSQLSPTAVSAPPVTADVYGGAGVSGRVFALNQLLAREQARSERLQADLDDRARELAAVRTEVQQLHDARNAPADDAMAATALRMGSQGNSPPAAPPAAVSGVGDDAATSRALIDDLRAQVAQERQRREAAETTLAQLQGETVPAAAVAALHAEVAQEQHRRESAETELARLKEDTAPAAAVAALHAEVAQEQRRREAAESELARLKEDTAPATVVAALHAEVAQEQHRREAAETQLARLKEETSTSPLAQADGAPAALAAAKQEVVDLRRALDEERATRERLADALHALQEQGANHDSHADGVGANAELRARLEKLEAEKQALVDGFNRSLTASQQRTAELEQQLQAAAGRGVAAGEVATVQAENAALRTRLDEEHRRTEALAAKLQLATRVTDLIFKMQAQQAQP